MNNYLTLYNENKATNSSANHTRDVDRLAKEFN